MLRRSGGRPLDLRRIRPWVLTGTFVLMAALPLAVASAGPVWKAPAPPSASVPAPAGAGTPARTSARPAVNAFAPAAPPAPAHAFGDAARDVERAVPSGDRGAGEAPVPGHRGRDGDDEGDGRGDGSGGGFAPGAGRPRGPLTPGAGSATTARCGPEVTSPGGIEAQTCVLTRGRQTWARTYYRNATGDDLRAVLTLMAPGDRTVRMHCALGADDEPGACETPREDTVGAASRYTAVAEFAEGADAPLLLRSGSNSPAQDGG